MPDYRMQHYVPQFYLRNFSDAKGRTINLCNLKSGKIISGASLRDQCARPYFYGSDLKVEKALAGVERSAAEVVRGILRDRTLPDFYTTDSLVLFVFVIALHNRTMFIAEEENRINDALFKAMFREHPRLRGVNLDNWRVVRENPIVPPLGRALETFPVALDLARKLISNTSNEPFITSDHPVVFYNQYMEGYQEVSCTGIASKGLQIFLPISPAVMLHLYDPQVYSVGSRGSDVCWVGGAAEALKLNELQWMNALENIYFSNHSDSSLIQAEAKQVAQAREAPRFARVGVTDREDSSGHTRSLIEISKRDLNVRLRPSFIRINKKAQGVSRLDRKPEVRSPYMMHALARFDQEVELGHYRNDQFLKYLADKTAERNWSRRDASTAEAIE